MWSIHGNFGSFIYSYNDTIYYTISDGNNVFLVKAKSSEIFWQKKVANTYSWFEVDSETKSIVIIQYLKSK